VVGLDIFVLKKLEGKRTSNAFFTRGTDGNMHPFGRYTTTEVGFKSYETALLVHNMAAVNDL
jgi:hypothetical protein